MMRTVAAMMVAASWPAMAVAQQAPAPAQASPPSPPAQTAPAPAAATPAPTAQAAQVSGTVTPTPAPAAGAEDEGEEGDIVVTGRKPPGSVVGDIPAEQTLGPADVRSYGVSSVSDLLTELAPQTQSGAGGPPVILLDGHRISGFQEIRDLPTEAILRVDILPEEVALKYGYTADQKVVNFVLRRRFRATTVELADRGATDGGSNTPQGELDLLTIRQGARLNIHSKYQQTSALTESERDISAATTEGQTNNFDQRPYRTLVPFSRSVGTNATYAKVIGDDINASINGEIAATQSTGQFGLPLDGTGAPVSGDPLRQQTNGVTGHLGTSFNGRLSPRWLWTVTGSFDRADTRTIGDTTAGRGSNRAHSVSNAGDLEALVNGPLFSLPAGDISTAIRVGAQTSQFTSNSLRAGLVSGGRVSRDQANARVNIDLPIASRSRAVLPFLGNLSVNANAAVNQLSDFGTLTAYGYGVNWGPINAIRVIGSINQQDVAPTAQQLGNPVVVTPNVRVFDYVQGQTVTVTTISGGNPALRESSRRVTKLGVTIRPLDQTDLTIIGNYTKQDTRNPIQGFPSPTAVIEAAFPDRFSRDADGELTRLDTRPVNFARAESSEFRWGINFSKPIKSKVQKQIEAFRAGTGPNPFAGLRWPGADGRRRGGGGDGPGAGTPPAGGDQSATAQGPSGQGGDGAAARGGAPGGDGGDRPRGGFGGPGGGGPGGGGGGGGRGFGGGGFGGGGRGGGGGRIQFAFYHTWHLVERRTIASGGPVLDLLNGDAVGTNGGQSRHELEGQAGYNNNGIGVRLSANYATGTRVNGGTAANPQALNFSGLATADLRLFADLGQRLDLVKAHPWLRGARVTFSVSNIFNSRQRVTDATGVTPISYQPDYQDPIGRTVRLSLRKLFF